MNNILFYAKSIISRDGVTSLEKDFLAVSFKGVQALKITSWK